MSNESNEFLAWRRVLRQPEALPEQGLADKDAAWDRLAARLSGPPRRRFDRYRVAAACLLILLIPAARLFHGRSGARDAQPAPAVVQQLPPPSAYSATPATLAPPASPAATGMTRLSLPASNVASRQEMASARQFRRTLRKPAGMLRIARPQAAGSAALAVASAPVPAVAPPQIAAITPPQIAPPSKLPKKEWKVVDINELDPGHSRPHGMASNRQPVFLRLGLGIGNAGGAETPSSTRDEESRLKLNLTTQNR